MAWWRRKADRGGADDAAIRQASAAVPERVLAAAVDVITGRVIVASVYDLVVVTPEGQEVSRRRWLEVDSGSWESETGSTSVAWVSGARGTQWTFGPQEHRFPEAFRDRVEASRVIDAPVVDGERTVGRAAIRKDLRTGELVPQVMFERRVRRDDAHARGLGERVLRDLREQVGL